MQGAVKQDSCGISQNWTFARQMIRSETQVCSDFVRIFDRSDKKWISKNVDIRFLKKIAPLTVISRLKCKVKKTAIALLDE